MLSVPRMSRKRKTWIFAAGLITVSAVAALFIASSIVARRFDPYIRQQAILYLQNRFDSDVELSHLKIRLPGISPLRVLMTRGRGSIARAEASGLVMRKRGGDRSPIFTLKHFTFDV